MDDQSSIFNSIKIKSSIIQQRQTVCEVDECTFCWTIKNFDSAYLNMRAGEKLQSRSFFMEKNQSVQWHLSLYPKGRLLIDSGLSSIFLYSDRTFVHDIKVNLRICVLDNQNKECCVKEKEVIFPKNDLRGFGFCNLFKAEELSELLFNSSLRIVLYIKWVNFDRKPDAVHDVQEFNEPLMISFQNLFETQEFSDFTIIAKDKEFKAHKVFLASASPVFHNMMTHNMQENLSNSVVIPDVGSNLIQEMLRFIYTGKVEKLEEIAEELMVIADRYQIQELKNLCEQSLCKIIDKSNAFDLLMLGDRHHGKRLRGLALDYIAKKRRLIKETEGSRRFAQENPLAADTFKAMMDCDWE